MSFSEEEKVSHLQKLLFDELMPRQPEATVEDLQRYCQELEEHLRRVYALFTPEILVNSLAEYSIEE